MPKKFIRVALPLDSITSPPCGKNPSGTGILPPCTCDGSGVRSRRRRIEN
ncbi:MAG: hypothetical protein LBS59_07170 [Puniceicoccales bacterium]|nr:hypothetical protein [Puniceicoccales bacterium]